MVGLVLVIVGGAGPIAILWYLSEHAVDPKASVGWVRRLSRDVYTLEGQRLLIRWRPMIFALWGVQVVGAVILASTL